jgi:hypothetical protein
MKRRKTRKVTASGGAPFALETKFEIVSRAGVRGVRIRTRLERMLENGVVLPRL